MFRIFFQPGIHAPRFTIRFPSLWFDDTHATLFQNTVYTPEKRGEALIAMVEMNPFRDGEAV